MRFNSLASRFLAISALWSIVALAVTAVLLTSLYKSNTQKSFQELLTAHLYNLMGSVDLDENGDLLGAPNLGDPHFRQPYSGWYWSVIPQTSKETKVKEPSLTSISMGEETLKSPGISAHPFKDGFLRNYPLMGFQGESISVVESQIFLGEGDKVFRFLVAGNSNALDAEISEFTRSMVIFLALFGLGMTLATFVIIKLGLKPLDRARHALNDIRGGNAERLEGEFPREIAPLITEMNALIDANKTVLERARTQVGNLAHALKTPISVLKNEARSPGFDLAEKVDEQAERMQEHVQRYLDRARIAAQTGSINARTPVFPVVERMLRVMQRLNPHLEFEHNGDAKSGIIFRGEQQDLEEVLGNLIENACKFAKNAVVVSTSQAAFNADLGANHMFDLAIEDDGPGLNEEQRLQAVKRGKRLDETKPGSGLGLSIVKDIVDEYRGEFTLENNNSGGLRALIKLPAITQ